LRLVSRALDQRLVLRRNERARCAVGHRERARVDVPRAVDQVHERELVHARVSAVLALVRGADHALLGSDARGTLPQRRELDAIDAMAPGIPLLEARLVEALLDRLAIEVAAGELTDLVELRLDALQDIGRQRVSQVAPQDVVGRVLIPELRRGLIERHRVEL
jgi:hypothetical protein